MGTSLFRETMEANTFAVFNLVHAALPFLRKSSRALIAISTPAIQQYANKDLLSVALKRLGTAEEVAEMVVFLASLRVRWVIGQQVNVDGGCAI